MAEDSYPFAGRGLLESQWRALWTSLFNDGVIRDETNGARVFANSSGRAVLRSAGGAWVQGSRWTSAVEDRYTVPSNTSTQPRIDRLVLRYNPTTHDLTTQLVVGTADANPQLPALNQNPTGVWEFPLAHWTAKPNFTTLNPEDVVDDRVFFDSAQAFQLLTVANIIATTARFANGHARIEDSGSITSDSSVNAMVDGHPGAHITSEALLLLDNRISDPDPLPNSVAVYCKGASLFARYPDGSVQKIGGPY